MRSTRSRSTRPRSARTRSTRTPSSGRGCATLFLMDLRLDHGSWATPWQLICVAITSSSKTPMMEKIMNTASGRGRGYEGTFAQEQK